MSSGGIIVVIILVAIIVVASVVGVVYYLSSAIFISRTSVSPGPVTISGLFLYIIYPDSSSNYFGSTVRSLSTLPIYLVHGGTYQTQFTLTLQGTSQSHTVSSMTLGFSGGFRIQSATPSLPVSIGPGSATIFTVTLQAPNSDYNGPVTIDVFTH